MFYVAVVYCVFIATLLFSEGNSVVITFNYMQTLRIVTAKCSVHLQEKTKSALTYEYFHNLSYLWNLTKTTVI